MQPHALRVFAFRPAHPGRPYASHSFERWLFTRLTLPQRLGTTAATAALLPAWGRRVRRTALGRQHGPRLYDLCLRLREPVPHTLHVFFTECHVAGVTAAVLLAGGVQAREARSIDALPGLGDARWIQRELEGLTAAGAAVPVLSPDSLEAVRAEDAWTFSPTGPAPCLVSLRALRDAVFREAEKDGDAGAVRLLAWEQRFALASSLLRARSSRRLTQRGLAALSGVPQDTISELENGQANPSLSTLTALAAALGVEMTIRLEERADAASCAARG
jgi:DNA-binding XRE family transcriptional regulator